ncbi:hypothetical protein POTOM_052392 [Populus tomentosa]|uniref:protein-tyrosine-phosphatase n=1 Tax=Populus tomentosa TaxID=118781 RepID=A0A8X8C0A0_POPTO|nr:hypothetical protein POTOM_052392 [Populus tomentosa]
MWYTQDSNPNQSPPPVPIFPRHFPSTERAWRDALQFTLKKTTLPSPARSKSPTFTRTYQIRENKLGFFFVMPYLVRENLFIGNISDAAEVLQNGSSEITHILSVLSSVSISFFTEWRNGVVIPAKEIKKVCVGDGEDEWRSCLAANKVLYGLEYAGKDLKLVRMAVPIRDMESEDLLDYLDVCLDFIEKSRKEGAVLVHCFAGVSRRKLVRDGNGYFGIKNITLIPAYSMNCILDPSVKSASSMVVDWLMILKWIKIEKKCFSAAIITAYLMKTEQLSLEDALESLRRSCESVCPNDGFLEQLKMFEEMGFKVDHASTIYKRFRLKVLGEFYNRGEKIDSSKFGADPGVPTQISSEEEASPNEGKKAIPAYRCKKCRRVVALQQNVVDHVPGEGETSFAWSKQKSGNPFNKSDESECSSLFVEPLKWMTAVEEGALEGKLSCAHCEARLGYFNWSGIQCSCGSWITPAFQLHKSRVDVSTA